MIDDDDGNHDSFHVKWIGVLKFWKGIYLKLLLLVEVFDNGLFFSNFINKNFDCCTMSIKN